MYIVQFVVGLVANVYSLIYLMKERLVLNNKNRMILLLIHLTCADLCVSTKVLSILTTYVFYSSIKLFLSSFVQY